VPYFVRGFWNAVRILAFSSFIRQETAAIGERRIRGDLIETFKIMRGKERLIDVSFSSSLLVSRGHTMIIIVVRVCPMIEDTRAVKISVAQPQIVFCVYFTSDYIFYRHLTTNGVLMTFSKLLTKEL